MYLGWLIIVTALLIVIYCLTIYIRTVVTYKKTGDKKEVYKTMVLMVKNQESLLEGLIREIFSSGSLVEVIVFDFKSVDRTRLILERLARDFPQFRFFAGSEEDKGIYKKLIELCYGNIIYCFDLTSSVNYGSILKSVHSVVRGSNESLYRTRVLYKNKTQGRCTKGKLVVK